MSGPKRTKTQRIKDRAITAEMYLRGATQAEIGAKLGCSQQQIGYDLKQIRAAWLQSALMDFNEAKARQLARIDELERTHWRAWMASTGKDKPGDPRYLSGVMSCVAERSKLLGLHAPLKQELSGNVAAPVFHEVIHKREELSADFIAEVFQHLADANALSPVEVEAETVTL